MLFQLASWLATISTAGVAGVVVAVVANGRVYWATGASVGVGLGFLWVLLDTTLTIAIYNILFGTVAKAVSPNFVVGFALTYSFLMAIALTGLTGLAVAGIARQPTVGLRRGALIGCFYGVATALVVMGIGQAMIALFADGSASMTAIASILLGIAAKIVLGILFIGLFRNRLSTAKL